MIDFDLLRSFVEFALERPLESVPPEPASGLQVVEALWPLNERFRPHLVRIRALPYASVFEPEADAALAALAKDVNADWSSLPAGAWRVLLERQQQAIMVALANEVSGNAVMQMPSGLSDTQRTVFAALFLLHGMALPWPAEDRSHLELPEGSARASLRLH